jgi:hypothetical protein
MVCYRRSSEGATRAATGSCRNGRQAATPPYATASTPCGLVFSLNLEIRTSSYATWPMRGGAAPWHSRDVTDRGRSAGDNGGGTVIWHSPALPPRPAMLPTGLALLPPLRSPERLSGLLQAGQARQALWDLPWAGAHRDRGTHALSRTPRPLVGTAGRARRPRSRYRLCGKDSQKNDRVAHILLLA